MNYFIYKIEFKNPEKIIPLGDRNFNYNNPIIIDKVKNADEYHIGFGTVKNPLAYASWEIREDGIYAIGYNRNALEPESTLIKDIKLLQNTYGYYLIDTNEQKHVKVESIDIEYGL